jgi:type II secretory pathway pseudopilin PulG
VTRLRDSSGFSLVEVLVAALILVVGAGAAFSLIDSANRSVTFNSARVGATNLARELTEYARTTDYDLLQDAQVVDALRRHESIAGTLAGSEWTIERRGVTYSVATDVCTFDDPKDGLGTTAPANACPAAAPVAGAPNEVNPDDFRRVTYTLSWNARSRPGSSTQAALLVNPAGGLGPRIEVFTEPAAQITGDSVSWGGALPLRLRSTHAASVRWLADDGISAGDAGGGPTDWGFDWDLGTEFSSASDWVRDGTYTLQAQAKDDRGVPGEAKIITVHVNRHAPAAVTGFAAGYNETRDVVDMRWDRYDERDLRGYRVTRMEDDEQICPATGGVLSGLSCTDADPPAGAATYRVVALDCVDLANTCEPRAGAPAEQLVTMAAGTAPDAPTGLTASVIDGKPTLSWTPPASVPDGPIRFYRVYRDTGTGLADRYDETVNSNPSYVDPNPGASTGHKYWVTAVDNYFNESPVSAPVVSPPLT